MYFIIDLLHLEMNVPKPYGIFHISCLLLVFLSILILNKRKTSIHKVILFYGTIAFALELLKQISWSIYIDESIIFDYQWYAFPFQFCSTPIYICLFLLLIKNKNLKTALYSYLAYFTILGSITTMLYPASCFVSDILVNIHTMWLHGGSLVVSIYILMNKNIKLDYRKGFYVFIFMLMIANILNIVMYNSSLLNGETFNMFYISPYFECTLPIFDIIYKSMNYFVFLFIYIMAIYLGSKIIYIVNNIFKNS